MGDALLDDDVDVGRSAADVRSGCGGVNMVTSNPTSSMGSSVALEALQCLQITLDSTLPRSSVTGYSVSSDSPSVAAVTTAAVAPSPSPTP
jgi:hypothetical protein